MKYYLLAILFLVGSISLIPSVFATIGAGPEFEPTQPNAFASYNNATNQVLVSWDFNTLPDYTTGSLTGTPAKCAIKGDFDFQSNPTYSHENSEGIKDAKINGFIPRFYSVVTSSPVQLQAQDLLLPEQKGEEIPCTGSFTMDMNTIINSEPNKYNLENVQIFLTFYLLTSEGEFIVNEYYRIDETLISFAPSRVLTNHDLSVDPDPNASDIQFLCYTQIGSVLMIDPSGSAGSIIAHGFNGDNCIDYIYLENNQYVDIGMIGSASPGAQTFGFHTPSFPLLVLVVYPSYSGGSSDCNDCIPPTLGINKRGQNMVSNGFSFNGVSTNVDYFHTPFPLIPTEIGVNNTMTFKIYENHGIKDITNARVGLGMESKSTPIDQAEVLLDIFFLKGLVKNIEITDSQFLIQNVTATSNPTKCKPLSNQEDCLEVILVYYYRESPMYNIVAVSPVDDNNNDWTVYFNDGIKVNGESLNPARTDLIAGNFYTQLDKWQDSWIDENGILYDRNSNSGVMIQTTSIPGVICIDKPLEEINGGYGRENCNFRAMTNLWD